MFWALKGAGENPSCLNIRQNAALMMLFPASEQVPTNMMGFNCFLCMLNNVRFLLRPYGAGCACRGDERPLQ